MPNETGKKKAQNQGQWISFVIFSLVGAACGMFLMMYLEKQDRAEARPASVFLPFALMLIGIYAGIMLHTILHEAGHLIFGLLTGYRFCSFRIGSLMWVKLDGRIRLKKRSVAGTGGQCLMIPPDLKDGKMPVMLYNNGGVIVNLITSILCFGLSFLCPVSSLGWTVLMSFAVIGLASALTNGLPLRMGLVNNDGKNALDLSRSQEAVRSIWIQMKVNEQVSQGIRLKDMPDEWFEMPDDESMNNGLVAAIGVLACSRLMDQHRFEEADQLTQRLLSSPNGIIPLQRQLMVCDLMYVEMITENRPAVLADMRTKEQLKMMKAMKTSPTVLRTEYVYALLAEKDPEKAEKLRKQFEQCSKTYPYPHEIEGERELIRIAEERQA